MPTVIKKLDANSYQLKDQVVAINRVTKVVKGGKNMSFAALVVVGDPGAGVVEYGRDGAAGRNSCRPHGLSGRQAAQRRRTRARRRGRFGAA